MTDSTDEYTVRLRVRQEIEYEFDFTLEEAERAEFRDWAAGEEPTPQLLAEFIAAGPAIDFDAFLTPINEVCEYTGDIEAVRVLSEGVPAEAKS